MIELRQYRHALTGKVGQYSDAVARLFPHLEPIEKPAAEPVTQAPDPAASDIKEEEAV